MKIGILGSPNTPESQWMKEEGEKRGHKVILFSTSDFFLRLKDNTFEIVSEYDFKSFDIFVVRGISRSYFVNEIYFNKSTEALVFLRYVHDILGKPVVDERLVTRQNIMSKMATSLCLSKKNLPQPDSFQFHNKQEVIEHIDKFPFPLIAKNPAGRKGTNIFKLDTPEKLKDFLKNMPKEMPFIFQEFLETDGDIRVLVIGYKAIGAMKRHIVPGDFRANISQGADAEIFELTPETTRLAEEAAKVAEVEIAGVDLIESKGKFYVIEVNRAPQFRGFKQYTKVDPSSFIIDYLEEKVGK